MWKCKECGSEVKANVIAETSVSLRKHGDPILCDIDEFAEIENYECDECGESSESLYFIANWIDNED